MIEALPSPNEPLRLADGTLVHSDGRVERPKKEYVVVPTHTAAQDIVARTRRTLADLPSVPKTTNAISVVLCYTMFGLSDQEIAIATSLTTEQVGRIKMLDAYGQMYDKVVDGLKQNESENVQTILSSAARTAAEKMKSLLDSENEGVTALAAKDILDRSGFRPADVVEHRHQVSGGLLIEVVKKDPMQEAPMIEINGGVDG